MCLKVKKKYENNYFLLNTENIVNIFLIICLWKLFIDQKCRIIFSLTSLNDFFRWFYDSTIKYECK